MENINYQDLIDATNGKLISGNLSREIRSVSTDSRTANKDEVFFALIGKKFDGHMFIKQVIKKEVSGVVVSRITNELKELSSNQTPVVILVNDTITALGDFAKYYRKKFSSLKVIAVTGSNGKTTTKEMIYHILNNTERTLANIGSFNNYIGLPLTLFNLNSEHKYCVLEVGISFPGEIERLIDISIPDISVITNIGRTHLEFFKNTDNVFNEKKKIVEFLPITGLAIINADDIYLKTLIGKLRCSVITFGFTTEAQIHPENIYLLSADRTIFDLCFPNSKRIRINLNTSGRFNIYNSLAAAATAYGLGVSPDVIKSGLENFLPINMRWKIINHKTGAIIIDDAYNANPDSMKESLLHLIEVYPERKKVVVLGDMLELGDRSEQEHRELGRFIKNLGIDRIYLLGENMKWTNEEINSESLTSYFQTKETLIQQLNNDIGLDNNCVIFFKASRGIGLDKIINELIK